MHTLMHGRICGALFGEKSKHCRSHINMLCYVVCESKTTAIPDGSAETHHKPPEPERAEAERGVALNESCASISAPLATPLPSYCPPAPVTSLFSHPLPAPLLNPALISLSNKCCRISSSHNRYKSRVG